MVGLLRICVRIYEHIQTLITEASYKVCWNKPEVPEWPIGTDCKSVGIFPTKVRILPSGPGTILRLALPDKNLAGFTQCRIGTQTGTDWYLSHSAQ